MTVGVTARARLPDHAVVLPLLLALSAVAWLAVHRLGDEGMRLGVLTGSTDEHAMDEHSMAHMSMAFGLFMGTWVVMMVAMMFPAVAPVVLTFRRWARSRERPISTTGAFVVGYLAVWSAIGIAAYGVLQLLQAWVSVGSSTAVRVGAALLVVAGAYQLTPLKDVCLKHCRSPLAVVMQYGSLLGRGHLGPFRVGIVHGAYCLGCCWSLFLVLILLGMMNLVWMGVVTAIVFAEKVLPQGERLSRLVGFTMITVGVLLLVRPDSLPALI
jgi:predicted metal-binding membrane protein